MSPELVKYQIGSTVYHKCSEDMGIVTAIVFRENGVEYGVVWSNVGGEQWHHSVELQKEPVELSEPNGKDDDDNEEWQA